MKFYMTVFAFFMCGNLYAQYKIDSLLGSKGVFNKLAFKKITPDSRFTFDIKFTVVTTAKGGSKKQNTLQLYINTKDGYVGIDKSNAATNTLKPSVVGLDFLIETLSQQSFRYTNTKIIGKKFEELSTNLVNTFDQVAIKKTEGVDATPKKYLKNSLTTIPYYIDVSGLQKKVVRYLYGLSYPASGQYKSYLGSFGVGFYNISNSSFLCVATENNHMKIEIVQVEKVNLVFNAAGFTAK